MKIDKGNVDVLLVREQPALAEKFNALMAGKDTIMLNDAQKALALTTPAQKLRLAYVTMVLAAAGLCRVKDVQPRRTSNHPCKLREVSNYTGSAFFEKMAQMKSKKATPQSAPATKQEETLEKAVSYWRVVDKEDGTLIALSKDEAKKTKEPLEPGQAELIGELLDLFKAGIVSPTGMQSKAKQATPTEVTAAVSWLCQHGYWRRKSTTK